MNTQNTNFLFQTFPSLFPEDRSDPRRTLMCFGFELGDECEIIQVKETWGTLRIHAYTSQAADTIIEEYEARSYYVCEECGQPGTLRTTGWHRTTCDQHVPAT